MTHAGPTIRPATAADAPAAAALLRDSIRRLCTADHGDDPDLVAAWCANKTPEHVARWIADPDQSMLVAERDGRLLGVAAAARDGKVLLNYVAPGARFSGVSSLLLAQIEAQLAADGVAEGRLESTLTALRFYHGRGWRDAGPPVRWMGIPGQPMRKSLGA